jgi:plasmid stability protein
VNVLIRDVPDEVVAALDAEAERQGISRTEYLRRMLTQAAIGTAQTVTVEHLARFEHVFSDLADPEVMDQAWR